MRMQGGQESLVLHLLILYLITKGFFCMRPQKPTRVVLDSSFCDFMLFVCKFFIYVLLNVLYFLVIQHVQHFKPSQEPQDHSSLSHADLAHINVPSVRGLLNSGAKSLSA